ncbi:MAG: MFS transporter [Parvibaculaceae bacterium]
MEHRSSNAMAPAGSESTLRIALVLAPFAFAYAMSYLYRAVNAVAAPDLVRDLGLSASELGFLAATYPLAFAAFQLPLGSLLDRFGPRRVQTALVCVTALGALVFATGKDFAMLTLAQALIGLSCAGGLMGGFKAVTLWVAEERRALANACIMATGGLGIFVATIPASYAIGEIGWRGLYLGLAALSLMAAAIIFFFVPERGERAGGMSLIDQFRSFGTIYADPVFWRLAPIVALASGCQIAIQTLWAGPWLRDVTSFGRDAVASHLAWIAVGFLVGTLTMGAVADWLGRRGVGLLSVMLGFVLMFMACHLLLVLQWKAAAGPLWFLFGMTGQAGILAYPWLSSYYGSGLAGRANTAVNFIAFSTAFAAQYTIGAVIDLWPQTAGGGYDPESYRYAFGLFFGLQCVALVWFLLKRPDRGRNKE